MLIDTSRISLSPFIYCFFLHFSSRESEFKLHQLAKHCLSLVEHQEMELSRAEQFPDNATTEPLIMRSQILNTYNSAMETEERVETLNYEEGLLREERKLLKRDFSRLPTAEVSIVERKSYLGTSGAVKSKVQFTRPGFIHRNGDVSLLGF